MLEDGGGGDGGACASASAGERNRWLVAAGWVGDERDMKQHG